MSTCPKGHESSCDDYCDRCGTPMGTPMTPAAATAATGPRDGDLTCRACLTPNRAGNQFCESCGAGLVSRAERDAAGRWVVVATADRGYYERMETVDIEFPESYVERRFVLGRSSAVIGRRSKSRGIDPAIDLAAAPEDPAVSRQHAILVPDGDEWTVIDPGSANGTYHNDDPEPIPRDRPVRLADGDRLHLGAWTTVTLRRSGDGPQPPSSGAVSPGRLPLGEPVPGP